MSLIYIGTLFISHLIIFASIDDYDNVCSQIFGRALMVVAPHGAGLSNLIFCQPGTYVIEALCSDNPLCYLWTAQILGHRWHGIMAK